MFTAFDPGDLPGKKAELEALIQNSRAKIEGLKAQSVKTYENFVAPYQRIEEALSEFFTVVAHLNHVDNNEHTKKAYVECLPLITEYSTEQSQDADVYAAFADVMSSEGAMLERPRRKVLEDALLGFRLSGVHLPEAEKKRVAEINLRLSELSNSFNQNLLDATNAFELHLTDEADVAGIPADDLARYADDEKGGWTFTLQIPSYLTYMTYGPNRAHRETLYRAYTTRAPENDGIIEEILSLRDEKAKLVGYDTYAHLSLAEKVAETPEEVIAFQKELGKKAKPAAKAEWNELAAFAAERGVSDFMPYDQAFFAEIMKRERFHYDEEKYKPYFERTRVVSGMFRFLEKLFGVSAVEVDVPVWHDTVQAFDLQRNGDTFARLYLDLEARKEKKGGAWMNNWHARYRENGRLIQPDAFVVANFPASRPGVPSLLTHDNVETLFHEMGHAIHHLSARVEEPFVSGIRGVEWDAVEFPSQFLQNFAWEKSVLQMFAVHHETGQVLSDADIDVLNGTRTFHAALGMVRQIEFGLFDMMIHDGPHTARDVQTILDAVRDEVAVVKPPAYNKFQNGFAHIFGGGYAAGYYSYKWAEVMSADAYYRFVDAGIFDAATADPFFEDVLAAGGGEKATTLFADWMGREPDPTALLRLYGIT